MKKLLVVLLSLMLVLTACGEKDKKSEDQSSSSETTIEANVENTNSNNDLVKSIKVNKSLKDKELLKALISNGNFEPPENYYMVIETTKQVPQGMAKIRELRDGIVAGNIFDMEELESMNSLEENNSSEIMNKRVTSVYCHYNGDVFVQNVYNRWELNRIDIFKKDTNTAYLYFDGENTGEKFVATKPSVDMSPINFGLEDLIKAEVQTFDGEEVIYMEYDNLDEEDNKLIDKIWFSIDKKFPVKMESVKEDGSIPYSFKALELEVDKDFSKYVEVPKNIEFLEN